MHSLHRVSQYHRWFLPLETPTMPPPPPPNRTPPFDEVWEALPR
jgi:hypothetical protein